MTSLASPLQIAAVAAAVGWPFVVGLGVVLWSKARAAKRQRQTAALEHGLQGLYRDVEGKPIPERLALVVDALEEAQALQPAGAPAKGPVVAA